MSGSRVCQRVEYVNEKTSDCPKILGFWSGNLTISNAVNIGIYCHYCVCIWS